MPVEEHVKKFVSLMNKRDLKALADMMAPQVTIIDPTSPQPIKGKEAVRKNFAAWFKAFPDLKMKTNTLIGKGNTAVLEITMSGTNSGPWEGPQGSMPATKKKIQMNGVGIQRYNAKGLMLEERRYYDPSVMMRQLGLIKG